MAKARYPEVQDVQAAIPVSTEDVLSLFVFTPESMVCPIYHHGWSTKVVC